MEDTSTIGQRVAHARKLRDLTQQELALRVPCSKSLIAQVERGHKPATPSFIAAAAKALNVDVTELTGQPYRGRTANSDRIHAAIPEIRQAVAYWDIPPELGLPPRPLDALAADVAQVNRLRMEASYVQLGVMLPRLIKELVVHVHEMKGREQERAFRLLAEVYTAVDSMAYKLGYMDLFALAVERMAWAAGQADDPLLQPVAAMRRSSVFLATGGWDGGMTLLAQAGPRRPGTAAARPPTSPSGSAATPGITACCSARPTSRSTGSPSRSNSATPTRPSAAAPGWSCRRICRGNGRATTSSTCRGRGCVRRRRA